ncbi:MAG: guanylate kinase [Elusimicrobia bacterium]|nr:guanylate kinase [Elusimicrobiota bacterium]
MPSRPGILLALSAPRGLGKVTLCQALLDREPEARLSVSCTTRPRHAREIEGFDFYFVSDQEFKRQAESGGFLEWVEIKGLFYGTPRTPLLENLAAGRDVILNVDTQGAQTVKKEFPDTVLVFVSPPTVESLVIRLKSLDSTHPENLPDRLSRAREDLAMAPRYDYVVLSDGLAEAADELSAILRAERRRARWSESEITQLIQTPPPLD